MSSRTIARIVRDFGPISRAEIAKILDVSRSTVGRHIDHLIKVNIVFTKDQATPTSPGRPSFPLEFNSQVGSVLVVDLRRTNAFAAITDMVGNILISSEAELAVGNPETSTADLISLMKSLIGSADDVPPLRAVIIGAASTISVDGNSVEWAHSLGWKNLPLKDILSKHFDVPIWLENAANLAALGEYINGVGRGKQNLIYVNVGTGIGAGIVINGELYRGSKNAAGEVSYLLVDIETIRDRIGQLGYFEERAARRGVLSRAQIIAQRYPASKLMDLLGRDIEGTTVREIFDLALEGDSAARVVFDETIDMLTIVISNLFVLMDPDVIVLGGPSDWNWGVIIQTIQERLGSSFFRPVELAASDLGANAVVMGGAALSVSLDGVLPFERRSSASLGK